MTKPSKSFAPKKKRKNMAAGPWTSLAIAAIFLAEIWLLVRVHSDPVLFRQHARSFGQTIHPALNVFMLFLALLLTVGVAVLEPHPRPIAVGWLIAQCVATACWCLNTLEPDYWLELRSQGRSRDPDGWAFDLGWQVNRSQCVCLRFACLPVVFEPFGQYWELCFRSYQITLMLLTLVQLYNAGALWP